MRRLFLLLAALRLVASELPSLEELWRLLASPAGVENASVTLTREMYDNALLPAEAGVTGGWLRFASLLQRGDCPKVAVLGGSNTCKPFSFAFQLQAALNAAFPCVGAASLVWRRPRPDVFPPVPADSSAVFNLCAGGMGSTHWAAELSWVLGNAAQNVSLASQQPEPRSFDDGARASFEERLLLADLVILETSVNDMRTRCCIPGCYDGAGYEENARVWSQRPTEVLARQLDALPASPAVLATGVLPICLNWDGRQPRTSDMLDAQNEILRAYAAPVVSPLDGLGPLGDFWFDQHYRLTWDGKPDAAHASSEAHGIIARFVAYAVGARALAAPSAPRVWPAQVPPRAASRHSIDVHLRSTPRVLDFHDLARTALAQPWDGRAQWPAAMPEVDAASGWRFAVDVPKKEGLVSTAHGDSFTLLLTPEMRRAHGRFGTLSLEMLKSYSHMGVLLLSDAARQAAGGVCAPQPAPAAAAELATARFDCA